MNPQIIIHAVSQITSIPVEAITSRKRTKATFWAKLIATREMQRTFPHWSLQDLGRALGGVNHATIIHRLRNADWLYATSRQFREDCESLWKQPLAPA